jgi:hypothetical protein
MEEYLFGLLTIPGPAVAWGLVLLVLGNDMEDWRDCRYCDDYSNKLRLLEPWWIWHVRSRLAWRRHLKASPACRERVEHWKAKRAEAYGAER